MKKKIYSFPSHIEAICYESKIVTVRKVRAFTSPEKIDWITVYSVDFPFLHFAFGINLPVVLNKWIEKL